jgi:hypothetical protein
MIPLGLSSNALARALNVTAARINEIVRESGAYRPPGAGGSDNLGPLTRRGPLQPVVSDCLLAIKICRLPQECALASEWTNATARQKSLKAFNPAS